MSKLDKAIEQVLFENNIPNEWSSEINNELDQLKSETNSSRADLTDKPFITIDGKDAKDFDDAVFCENKDSNIILWVAIADVAEIVAEDSKIDLEAFKRGTSIYFPKNVVPMLPEKISNNLCSLVPNEKRNVLVCKIKFHDDGEINSYEFIEAFISSQRRFTYSEVSNYDHDNEEISHSLESLKILTNKLLKKRAKRNALEIQSQDPLILIDEHGEIESISIPKRLFAHQMIEESMISANICAADFMKKNYGYGVYRVHEEPEFLKVESLKNFFSLKGLSYSKELNSLNLINAFINHANKNQESKIFNILILQSLKRAKYSTQEIGHFGLQLEKYSHFTSPIRRYPDLITHRLIKNMINSSKKTFSKELLEENLENLSDLERRAEIASRQVNQQMICYQLEKFIGDELSTIVVGITEFGLFCEIENYFISGLIHVSDLSRDRYIYDNQANILKGKRTGKTYRIGQKINAQLVSIVPEDRKITLVPK